MLGHENVYCFIFPQALELQPQTNWNAIFFCYTPSSDFQENLYFPLSGNLILPQTCLHPPKGPQKQSRQYYKATYIKTMKNPVSHFFGICFQTHSGTRKRLLFYISPSLEIETTTKLNFNNRFGIPYFWWLQFQGLGKYKTIYVFMAQNVFGNKSRNKLADWVFIVFI